MLYKEEVPTELVVGKEYTLRQVGLFIKMNKNVIVLSDSIEYFANIRDEKVLVVTKEECFAHYVETNSYFTKRPTKTIYHVKKL
ncbi:hypothetical protein ACFQI7_20175 [Paenibacillus allorhizosphaerae]|uniref:Uncharacterized protein n=1 Tax=Paenibacillus allorhizosphaerae TaxID=2849866 RepID=A0ABM8VKR3_9BACL|nr:hypothetical protein [Paenibacillus allorhizosphaerae]CAG7647427.1 hypothetical protein PAECIP111802_03972 [Paenibacillus allorhizosphaerae]